jgi:5-methylcytosine-specific restriction endonuclease McrA
MREASARHRVTHHADYLESYRRRHARKRASQIERFSGKQLAARMSVFGNRCAYCGGPFEEVDHAIPLARGGIHCLANLRPACRSCNRRKWAKPLGAWLKEVAQCRQV